MAGDAIDIKYRNLLILLEGLGLKTPRRFSSYVFYGNLWPYSTIYTLKKSVQPLVPFGKPSDLP